MFLCVCVRACMRVRARELSCLWEKDNFAHTQPVTKRAASEAQKSISTLATKQFEHEYYWPRERTVIGPAIWVAGELMNNKQTGSQLLCNRLLADNGRTCNNNEHFTMPAVICATMSCIRGQSAAGSVLCCRFPGSNSRTAYTGQSLGSRHV